VLITSVDIVKEGRITINFENGGNGQCRGWDVAGNCLGVTGEGISNAVKLTTNIVDAILILREVFHLLHLVQGKILLVIKVLQGFMICKYDEAQVKQVGLPFL